MTRRLAAAVAGAVLLLGVFLAYSVDERPTVAGSNTVAPFHAALPLPSGAVRCRGISRVPAKANRVRVIATAVPETRGTLDVHLSDASGVIAKGVKKNLGRGALVIRLNRLTRSAHPAEICFANRGEGRIVLTGEDKRVKGSRGARGERQGVPSVVFLRPRLSTWGARKDLIAERFANAQPGAFGGWSLWFAVALLAVALALAFWWLIFRLEPRDE
jgi:hypothetical protein